MSCHVPQTVSQIARADATKDVPADTMRTWCAWPLSRDRKFPCSWLAAQGSSHTRLLLRPSWPPASAVSSRGQERCRPALWASRRPGSEGKQCGPQNPGVVDCTGKYLQAYAVWLTQCFTHQKLSGEISDLWLFGVFVGAEGRGAGRNQKIQPHRRDSGILQGNPWLEWGQGAPADRASALWVTGDPSCRAP